jgi:hypothetical protein
MTTPPTTALVALAVDTASALVRSYCRSTITPVVGDVAYLPGTPGVASSSENAR